MNRNRLPKELAYYLDVTEQDPRSMTDGEILEEARYVHYMHNEDGNIWNEEAAASDKRTLAKFIEREEKRLRKF